MSGYLLSYTSASLLPHESEIVAKLYIELHDWDSVRRQVVDDNILQKGTLSTRKREFVEIKKRLQTLTSDQLNFYETATNSDSRYLTMLSCLKLYKFIYDFLSQTVRDKLLLFDYTILNSDYESFYDSKRAVYENLNTISESTQKKLKQVLFKILEQADFIDSIKNKNIQKPYLSEKLIELIVQDDPKYLRGFLYSDGEIDGFIKRFR